MGGGKRNTVDSGVKKAATTDKGLRTRSDDGNWITINGTHVPIDKDGSLMGAVGEKISGSKKQSVKRKWSSNQTWKPSSTQHVESLLEKPADKVTMKDTRQAIKEYKEQFSQALESAKSAQDGGLTALEIRMDFDRYHKELANKMLDIEKNGNTKTMEGRVAIKDAQRFLWDGAGCDRGKIDW